MSWNSPTPPAPSPTGLIIGLVLGLPGLIFFALGTLIMGATPAACAQYPQTDCGGLSFVVGLILALAGAIPLIVGIILLAVYLRRRQVHRAWRPPPTWQ